MPEDGVTERGADSAARPTTASALAESAGTTDVRNVAANAAAAASGGISDTAPAPSASEATGIVGPTDRAVVADEAAGEAALRAVSAVHKRRRLAGPGGASADVLDALEEAEADYEAAHAPASALAARVEAAAAAGAGEGSAQSPPPPPPARACAAVAVDGGTRAKVVARLEAALAGNVAAAGLSASARAATAAAVERACAETSSSRAVYFSKAGNAARLAARAGGDGLAAGELVRVASGAQRAG